jgi:PAS domain S-box-containing protein
MPPPENQLNETTPRAQLAPEDREREAARRRGAMRERERAEHDGQRRELPGRAPGGVAALAFAALADNVRDYAVFLMDPDGVITYWGEGARLIKWWTKDQAEGGHLRLLYPTGGSDDGTAEEHIRLAAERGEYTGEGQRVRSDGSTFWAGVTLTALWDDSGTLLGFAKTTRDLTARRAADALLQAAAEAAEAARRDAVAASIAKSGFLSTMSHEIRTPINAVLGYLELLELEIDGPLTAGQRRHLARAGASSRHLLALITEVLDFSRIEADRVTVSRSALRVGDVVAGALGLVGPQARARDIELSDAVSGLAAALAAWGDEARVRQILVNLLDNAIKFTAARNGQPGRVTISAGTATQPSPDAQLDGAGPWIYIRVEDTGVGIPSDRLGPIFDPFVQADMTLTRTHGGTGLGLAISRRLARLMGGEITVRSEIGVGSAFFLWLPAAPLESLQAGGIEGQGPATDRLVHDPRDVSDRTDLAGHPGGGQFRALGDIILSDMERVLHAYVARLRGDAETPRAREMSEAQVEDHLASFLADLAATLRQVDDGDVVGGGEPTPDLYDGSAIQRMIAERHGAQRARLGWTEDALRRDFAILREELFAATRRGAPRELRGPDPEGRLREAERAEVLLSQFLAVAERLSLLGYHGTESDDRGV